MLVHSWGRECLLQLLLLLPRLGQSQPASPIEQAGHLRCMAHSQQLVMAWGEHIPLPWLQEVSRLPELCVCVFPAACPAGWQESTHIHVGV